MNKRYIDFVPTKKTATGGGVGSRAFNSRSARVSSGVGTTSRKPTRTVSNSFDNVNSNDFERIIDTKVKTDIPKARVRGVAAKRTVTAGMVRNRAEKPNKMNYTYEMSEAIYQAMPSQVQDDEWGVITTVDQMNEHLGHEAPVMPMETVEPKSRKGKSSRASKTKSNMKSGGAKASESVAKQSAPRKEYQVPKSPFINQANVAKRPLSKNVYSSKKVVPTKESKGTVAIITKPEKDSHAGIIVGIVLTIILGAAAGTIAFLLLPK